MSRERCCKRQDEMDFWVKLDQSVCRGCVGGWIPKSNSNEICPDTFLPLQLCRSQSRPRDLVLRWLRWDKGCVVDETSCSVCGSGMCIRYDTIQVGGGRYCSWSKPFRPVVPPRVKFPLFWLPGFSFSEGGHLFPSLRLWLGYRTPCPLLKSNRGGEGGRMEEGSSEMEIADAGLDPVEWCGVVRCGVVWSPPKSAARGRCAPPRTLVTCWTILA